jgi:hypothetical protein
MTKMPEHWRNDPPLSSIYKHPSIHNLMLVHSIHIAHVLWSAAPKAEAALCRRIKTSLKRTPLVTACLGDVANMKNGPLEALLREKLDPLELMPEAWPDKIRFAEDWMCAEAFTYPGKRGISPKTSWRIAYAEQLVISGKSITEIAEILQISRVAILNWCARGRAPKLKELFACRADSESA